MTTHSDNSASLRPRRSVLYMPAANERALEKAKTLPADAIIFDLEDAVDGAGQDDPRRVGVIQSKAAGIVRLCVKQISKQSSCAFFILDKLL